MKEGSKNDLLCGRLKQAFDEMNSSEVARTKILNRYRVATEDKEVRAKVHERATSYGKRIPLVWNRDDFLQVGWECVYLTCLIHDLQKEREHFIRYLTNIIFRRPYKTMIEKWTTRSPRGKGTDPTQKVPTKCSVFFEIHEEDLDTISTDRVIFVHQSLSYGLANPEEQVAAREFSDILMKRILKSGSNSLIITFMTNMMFDDNDSVIIRNWRANHPKINDVPDHVFAKSIGQKITEYRNNVKILDTMQQQLINELRTEYNSI